MSIITQVTHCFSRIDWLFRYSILDCLLFLAACTSGGAAHGGGVTSGYSQLHVNSARQ